MIETQSFAADLVKLFSAPSDISAYISAILGPLPYLKIFPTNGVDLDNMLDIFRAGTAGVEFVNPLFHPRDLRAGNSTAVQERASITCERLSEL